MGPVDEEGRQPAGAGVTAGARTTPPSRSIALTLGLSIGVVEVFLASSYAVLPSSGPGVMEGDRAGQAWRG